MRVSFNAEPTKPALMSAYDLPLQNVPDGMMATRGGAIVSVSSNATEWWSSASGAGHNWAKNIDAGATSPIMVRQSFNGSGGGCTFQMPLSDRRSANGLSNLSTWYRLRYRWRSVIWNSFSSGVGACTIGLKNVVANLNDNTDILGFELRAFQGDWVALERRLTDGGSIDTLETFAPGMFPSLFTPTKFEAVFTEGDIPTLEFFLNNVLIHTSVGISEMPLYVSGQWTRGFAPTAMSGLNAYMLTYQDQFFIEEV